MAISLLVSTLGCGEEFTQATGGGGADGGPSPNGGTGGAGASAAGATASAGGATSTTGPAGGAGAGGDEPIPQCSPGNAWDLSDDFEDGVFTPLWQEDEDISGPVLLETGGAAVFVLNATAGERSELESFSYYDLRGCSVSVEVIQAPAPACNARYGFTVTTEELGYIEITVSGAEIDFEVWDSGTQLLGNSEPFVPETHRFWRISADANDSTVALATSSDGLAWVLHGSVTVPFALAALKVEFFASTEQNTTTAGQFIIDNVNWPPARTAE